MSSNKDKKLVEDAIEKYYSQNGNPVKLLEFLNILNDSIESCFKFIYHSKDTFDSICKTCKNEICLDCTYVRCSECDNDDCCKFCLITCNECYNDNCNSCMKFCEECKKYYCKYDYNEGSNPCNICGNDCSHQCTECSKCYDIKCIGIPITCSYNCSNSINLCSSHFKQCVSCKQYTCRTCINNHIVRNMCKKYYYCNNCIPLNFCKCGKQTCKCCMMNCTSCNLNHCLDCIKNCKDCYKTICINCSKDKKVCHSCNKIICCYTNKCECSALTLCNGCNPINFTKEVCTLCNKILCTKCLKTSKSCNKCKRNYCKKCRSGTIPKKIIYNIFKNEYLCRECNN